MPAGIEIIGGASLNQDSKVMQLVSKVSSASMSVSTSGSGIYQRRNFSYSFPYSDCIYAVSLVSGSTTPVVLWAGSPSGGSTSVVVACEGSSTAPVFDVYAFRPGGGGPVGSGAGIEIYRADASLGFGSGYKPFRPLSQFEWRVEQSGDETILFNADDYALTYTGKRVACVFSRHAEALEGTGTFINRATPVHTAHFRNTDSTGDCRLTWIVTGNAGKDLPYWERKGRYMFIDVTNY